ncbi:MAG: phosphoglycerate kinase [Phycisphaerae bacterium]|nr:phosphoglycerate kinase [Phycisphaerae bacterium]
MPKRVIDQIDVTGKSVLMRVDFNVPIEEGRITDDRRIVQALPSIRSVLDRGGRLTLMSHLGRPSGRGFEEEFSMEPVARRLGELLSMEIPLAPDCVGPDTVRVVASLRNEQCVLLENLRFHAEETLVDQAKKNPDKRLTPEQAAQVDAFASKLASLGALYCNDAFGTCHRRHVSMYDVPMKIGAGRRVCGFLLQKELKFLGDALFAARRPFIAILGGAKVSDKIGVIESLLPKVDRILIGGAMAYSFFKARGQEVGRSRCEADKLDLARRLMEKAGDKLVLPSDNVCAAELAPRVATQVVGEAIPSDQMGLDVGPQTVERYRQIVLGAKTVLWNGPLGAFETPPFDAGTRALAEALAEATARGATTIIGGGDSAAAVEAAGLAERITHISTGGGASLEFLEGKSFPTIDILDEG